MPYCFKKQWSIVFPLNFFLAESQKCSIEVDVHSSQTTAKKVLSEVFYPLRAQQSLGQQYGFSDQQISHSQYDSIVDWSRDEFY